MRKYLSLVAWLLAVLLSGTSAYSAVVEEMGQNDRMMFEVDEATGKKYPLFKSKGTSSGGASVQTSTIASGVTTNTSSTPVAGVAGNKTYWAHVTGTGAVTATVEHRGCQTSATTYCVSLGTITLSGTTTDYDVPTPAVGTANYPYHYIVTTNVTGTGATVSAGVNY